MISKGLAITSIFEAESSNYGESFGNLSTLKKVVRGDGKQYTYISRQALRYNIVDQLGEELTAVKAEGSGEKKVIQFLSEANINDFVEIDLFGYMKTKKGEGSATRTAKVRLSNAISLEAFKEDTDFLTNKGLADRVNANSNIAQSEIHKSYYRYTLVADLDQIGIDINDDITLEGSEKLRRVNKLLDTVSMLYRDIRGRREDLKPLFCVGGVYDIKNPVFQNVVDVKNNRVIVSGIEDSMFDIIKNDTYVGLISGKFDNDDEIKEKLRSINMPEFFKNIKERVKTYYGFC